MSIVNEASASALAVKASQANNITTGQLHPEYSLYLGLMLEMTNTASRITNCVLIVVGLLVNSLVIVVFVRAELRKLSISIYTISLAMSDMCLLGIPVSLKWLHDLNPELELFRTRFWCRTHGYFDICFCCWSAWNIVALSSERWMVICRPSRVYSHAVNYRPVITALVIPFVSLLLFIWYPLLMEYREYDEPNMVDSLNGISSIYCKPSDQPGFLKFGIASISLSYLIPFILIAFFNSRIVRTLNQRIARRKEYFGKTLNRTRFNNENDRLTKKKKKGTQSFKGVQHNTSYFSKIGTGKKSGSTGTKQSRKRAESDGRVLQSTSFSPAGTSTNTTAINTDQTTQTNLRSDLNEIGEQFHLISTDREQLEHQCQETNGGKVLRTNKESSEQQRVSFLNDEIRPLETVEEGVIAERLKSQDKATRRMSRQLYTRYSHQLVRKPSDVLHVLDGKKKRSSGSNTDILRAREQMNQYQRIKNDRSISFMLVTVSIAFLVLTFPFQIVWLADQIYKLWLEEKKRLPTANSTNLRTNSTFIVEACVKSMNITVFQNISYANSTSIGDDCVKEIKINVFQIILYAVMDVALIIRNLNFSINFFLYSTMSNLFRKELNVVFQSIGFYDFVLFKNSISSSTTAANGDVLGGTTIICSSPNRSGSGSRWQSRLNSGKSVNEAKASIYTTEV